jgi:tetratricopeptide (TPR) repeat protein
MIHPNKRRRAARPAPLGAPGDGEISKIPLRLAVTKGGLGLELDGTLPLGFADIEQLSISLVGLSFPVDLSGGVARFRHRRGALERLSIAARRDKVTAALAPAMRGVLGPTSPAVTAAGIPGGVMIGIASGTRALAFDLLWAPSEGDARFVVCQARGIGLETPALAAALRAIDGVVGSRAERAGAAVAFVDAAGLVGRSALPPAGARAPDARDVRWGQLESDTFGFRIACDRSFSPPLLAPGTVREIELARLTEAGDDALAGGDLATARDIYVSLLERSPRDAELARRLADIDHAAGDRAEAALSTLLEAMPLAEAGFLAGELLAATGNTQGALLSLKQAAEREPYGPLSALALLRASSAAETIRERLELLDQAVARSPALEAPRWARFGLRLELADLKGAMADAEHLEAAALGAHRRHEVWRRAADEFLSRGHHAKAITLFERALRYAPDNPSAVSGLARSLLAAGRSGRALDLMARAVELAEKKGSPSFDSVMSLARALAESAGDLPHAIARLRTIPAGEPESLDARGLEGRYRASLGDLAGASMAFAQMRDLIELANEIDSERAATWLVEAARFEKGTKRDPLAAQRHLAIALQLLPRDTKILSAFREVAALAAAGPMPFALDAPAVSPASLPPATRHDEDADEALAESLTDRLRGDPENHAVALQLADVLGRLGRDLELFALLSARLEDADEKARAVLVPRQRGVLERLVAHAERERRADEQRIYSEALARLR